MVDVTHDAGEQVCDVRTAGTPRPAYRNLQILTDKLDPGWDCAARLGDTTGVRGWRFERPGYTLWVLWNEDGVLELPGETETPVEYDLALACTIADLVVTHAVPEYGAYGPEVEEISTTDCGIHLELTSVPVFVEHQL